MPGSKKLKVAISGNIGSGKSTFAKFISEAGFPVIFADDISKEILAGDPDVRKQIIKQFGSESFNGNNINKKYIADKIFSNPEKLKKINLIIHPLVRKRIDSLSKDYFKTHDIVFVEAALIYESKIEKMYDFVVLITADKDLRMRRSTETKQISEADFLKRDKNQLKEEVKKRKADFIFSNNGSIDELRQKALLLTNLLRAIL
jgi:dephospho-CoA kinase